MNRYFFIAALMLLLGTSTAFAQEASVVGVETLPHERTWQVDEVQRQALIAVPATAKTQPTPVVFIFHGHGGKMEQAMKSFSIHRLWPEAMVICPQGLNTPGKLTDPEGKKVSLHKLRHS